MISFLPHLGRTILIKFQQYIYRNIGNRIRQYRKYTAKLKQDDFCTVLNIECLAGIDRFRLSIIENGKNKKEKNPYLLSGTLISAFCKMMNIDRTTLLFGDLNEQESFIKLILLVLIINGDKHYKTEEEIVPIIDCEMKDTKEFLRLSMLNIGLKDKDLSSLATKYYVRNNFSNDIAQDLNKIKQWLTSKLGFFADTNKVKQYRLLMNGHESDYEPVSNMIIKLLFGDLGFAIEFMSGRINLDEPGKRNAYFEHFINNTGLYGGFAIDWNEVGFTYFIQAFNSMWDRNREKFINFFSNRLFLLDEDNDSVMKKMTDEYFDKIIKSQQFMEMLRKVFDNEQYKSETMAGYNYVRSMLQMSNINNNDPTYRYDFSKDTYDIQKLNYDMINLAQFYDMLRKGQVSQKEELFLFIKKYTNINELF